MKPWPSTPLPLRSRPTPGAASAPLRGWASLGLLCGGLLTATLQMPAHVLAWGVDKASGERVRLLNTSGTLWNGSATLALAPPGRPEQALALPGRLQWQLRPAWLGLDLQAHAECCTRAEQPLRLSWRQEGGQSQWQLSSPASHWPTTWLAGLGTPWNTLAFGGTMQFQADLRGHSGSPQWHTQGQARLVLHDLTSPLSTLHPLGSYQLEVQGGAEPRLQLSTLSGALQLQGQGQWVGQHLRFRGQAQAQPEREAVLGSLLNLIGLRQGNLSVISIG